MSQVLFWTTASLIVYAYIGFPLLLFLRALRARPVARENITPTVSMIIVAYNEAKSIGEKLENTLALDYPSDQLEIVVASDGSDDGTDAIVSGYQDRGVRFLACPRRGKIAALNDAVARASGDVLVFSDANSMFDKDAIRMLVRAFADAEVGAVAGNQCYLADGSGGAASWGERMYWNYDRTLKTMQNRAGSVIAATGAIHAIRRSLFQKVPAGVCDDFLISTTAIRNGQRLVFEPQAIAREPVATTDRAEFRRKTRIAARGLRTLWHIRELLNPWRHGFYAVQLLSHKLLRWGVCWLLILLLGLSILLWQDGLVYQIALAAQTSVYAAALCGLALRRSGLARAKAVKALALPLYFCLANSAVFCAWLQLMQGRRFDVWNSQRPLPRPAVPSN